MKCLTANRRKYSSGFTLVELVAVIIIVSIVGLGVGNFVSTSTQIYVDSAEREEVIGSSRFIVERLNRDVRYALPNSIRVAAHQDAGITVSHCLEFTPIQWSTFYIDLPVVAAEATDIIQGPEMIGTLVADSYDKDSADNHFVVVYPTDAEQVYSAITTDGTGRRVGLSSVSDAVDGLVTVVFDEDMIFEEESSVGRFYIVDQPISYCYRSATGQLTRHTNYGFLENQTADVIDGAITVSGNPSAEVVLMAEYMVNELSDDPTDTASNQGDPFRIAEASLTRNAIVHTLMVFEQFGEKAIFNNEIHVRNAP